MTTRWPLTVMLLRSQSDDLGSREYRAWLERLIHFIRADDLGSARRAASHLGEVWLFAGDPT